MAFTKSQKQKIVEELKEKIGRQKSVVFFDISGVKVKDLSQLRRTMKEKNCELKVAKKTLLDIASAEKGIKTEMKKITGEIALGFGFQDEISPFQIGYKFSKEAQNVKILGGILEKEIIDQEKAIFLGTLPSKEGLLTKLVGSISAPISGFLNVLQGNIKGLIYVLGIINK